MKIINLLIILVVLSVAKSKSCTQTSDCQSLDSMLFNYNCEQQVCVPAYKSFFPLTQFQVIGLCVIGLAVGFANAGGIGGGPVMVPLVSIFFEYKLKECISISYLLVFGGAIGNFTRFGFVRSEVTKGPVVNYDLVIMSTPLLSVGAQLGVLLNKVLPEIFLCITIIFICAQASHKTYNRLIKQWDEEKSLQQKKNLLKSQQKSQQNIGSYSKFEDEYNEQQTEIFQAIDEIKETNLRNFYLSEKKLFPFFKIAVLILFLLYTIMFQIVRGTDVIKSSVGIEYCGFSYWLITLIYIFLSLFAVKLFCDHLHKNNKLVLEIQEKYPKALPLSTFKLDDRHLWDLQKLAFISGCLGGMLGLGGGIILTPIWLSMGFLAQEVTVSSILAVIINSGVSSFTAAMNGDIGQIQGLVFMIVSYVSSLFIAIFLRWVVEKTGKQSILLILLLIKIIFSMFALPVLSIIQFRDTGKGLTDFNNIC